MHVFRPHFLLYSEASSSGPPRWKFVLQSVGGDECLSASDTEAETRSSRLELLAVVRGLEALGQPSRVTLLTRSRYVIRGLSRELAQWREKQFCWERFGEVVPIRDHDLWQRIDHAMKYHQVECCAWHAADHVESRSTSPGSSRLHRLALKLLPRGGTYRPKQRWSIAALLGTLREGILSPLSPLRPGTFTRAA